MSRLRMCRHKNNSAQIHQGELSFLCLIVDTAEVSPQWSTGQKIPAGSSLKVCVCMQDTVVVIANALFLPLPIG